MIRDWLEHNQFLSGGLVVMVIGSVVAFLRRLPHMGWAWVVRRFSITVEVPDRDPAFRWLQTWIARQRYAQKARDLSLTTAWEDASGQMSDDEPYASYGSPRAKFLLSPAPGRHVLFYRRRMIVFERERRDLQNGGAFAFQESFSLKMLGGDRAMLDQLLHEAYDAAQPRVPGVSIMVARLDSWTTTAWRPRRPLASVVLADDMLDDLLADLRAFLRSRIWYAERGVPHRRGYLLHGPPGNGKTSLVAAIAGELGLAVAILSLNSKSMTDEHLRELIDDLPMATILLIEDVDCAFGPARVASKETTVTLSGLLNALDGVSSGEGRVLFLTTNHPERLDPALVRPGRVDRQFRLGHTTPDQARRLFTWFYGGREPSQEVDRWAREFAKQIPHDRVCMAAIQEHLLRHRTDPELALRAADFTVIGTAPASQTEQPPDPSSQSSTELTGAWRDHEAQVVY